MPIECRAVVASYRQLVRAYPTGGGDYEVASTNLGQRVGLVVASALMVDYTPSEFSRIRLQWGQSKTQAGVTDNQLFLQYILTLGAHGAHKF